MSTDPNRLERRGAQRFEVHLPLAIQFEGRTVPGFTQALSGRGIFFLCRGLISRGRSGGVDFHDALRDHAG